MTLLGLLTLTHHLKIVFLIPTFLHLTNLEVSHFILRLWSLHGLLNVNIKLLSPPHVDCVHFGRSVRSIRRIQQRSGVVLSDDQIVAEEDTARGHGGHALILAVVGLANGGVTVHVGEAQVGEVQEAWLGYCCVGVDIYEQIIDAGLIVEV